MKESIDSDIELLSSNFNKRDKRYLNEGGGVERVGSSSSSYV